jgi:hypothetical protein
MMPEIPDRLTIPERIPETRLIPRPPTFRRKLIAVMKWRMTMNYRPHKVGGEPDWIQGEETPECCGRRAMFYGQLGSLGGKYDLCDNGIIYIFVCRKCLKTHSVLQFS